LERIESMNFYFGKFIQSYHCYMLLYSSLIKLMAKSGCCLYKVFLGTYINCGIVGKGFQTIVRQKTSFNLDKGANISSTHSFYCLNV